MKRYNKQTALFSVRAIRNSIFLMLTLFLVISCQKTDPVQPISSGKAPDFELTSLDGGKVTLASHINKVVVLFFFGNNCPSCKAAAPSVESMLVTPFAGRNDYQILGLDQWDGNTTAVQDFKTNTGVSFPLLLYASSVANKYKTTYDRLVVIDKNGEIVFSGTMGAASDIAKVKALIESLIDDEETIDDTPQMDDDPPVQGNAPDFTLVSLSGENVSLSDYPDQVVVLFFLGNNCPFCKAAVPDVESKLIEPYESRSDYVLLGLDTWNGNQSTVEAFKSSTGATFQLLLNASEVAQNYGTTYDRLIVVDKKGDIAFKGSQGTSADIETVKQKVQTLLGL